mmetsp:Transcript_11901/g.35616  ORF Transcript_11901/g.35616 Transcript_11901/m.35616 type:complete len:420 (+) Transcript_11901:310-1569(+)|eukprot:CAMPEP_0206149742 /NCGR_PEP_ID=MMETSP1473-20131121/37941_1 /ASSEMBLY_ACC=CAM_ASM_001109 /TAXON_ID=1461547 /ORGANISM="Stichococcus sp, Strain RCC1054" /LENGTH=419 /DNA_ID=CAMNT_0053547223 /DNA_START=284 /DNA_END=1543 /DNA_ORIENTATION=+
MRRFAMTFGCGDFGRLGHGSIAPEQVPRAIAALASQDIRHIAAAGAHTSIVTESGEVWTAGLNDAGQLGHSPGEESVNEPRRVDLPDAASFITAGHYHTVALTTAGELWTWGRNSAGQLGLGSSAPSKDTHTPQKVTALAGFKITNVAAGAEHNLAVVDPDGDVYGWGSQAGGRLGVRPENWLLSSGRQAEPRIIRGLSGILNVAAGHQHSGAVSRQGEVFMFGSNRFSQLGLQREEVSTPTPVMQLQNVHSLALGGLHSLAIPHSNQILSWGANQNGLLGLGSHANMNVSNPTLVPNVYALSAAAGWKHNLAIGMRGQLMSWGWGGSAGSQSMYDSNASSGGQLGLDSEFDFWEPATVPAVVTPAGGSLLQEAPATLDQDASFNWRCLQVSCGFNHSAAVVEMSEEDAARVAHQPKDS